MATERELLIRVSQSGNALTNLTKLGAVIAGLGVATIAYGVAANESFESLRVGLESGLAAQTGFTRGSDKLNAELDKMIAGLNEIGVVSPFSTEAMQEMGKTMMNMGIGFGDVIPLAQKFGDIIAASGGKTQNLMGAMRQFTQGMGKGKFSMQDFNSMVENGFPIWAMLSEHLNMTTGEVRALQSAGELTSDMVYDAIMAFDKFDGAMAAAAGTSAGLRETLADLFKLAMAKFTAPIFDVWKDSLQGLVNLLNTDAVQNWISAAADDMAKFMEVAIATFSEMYNLIATAIRTGDWSPVTSAIVGALDTYIYQPIKEYVEGTYIYGYFKGMAYLIADAFKTGDWSAVLGAIETYIVKPLQEADWDNQMLATGGTIIAALGRGLLAALAAGFGLSVAAADRLAEWMQADEVTAASNEFGQSIGRGIVEGIKQFFSEQGAGLSIPAIIAYITQLGAELRSSWTNLGIEFILGLIEGIVGSLAGEEFAGKVVDAFRPAVRTVMRIMAMDFYGLGRDIVEGIADGVKSSGALGEALMDMARSAWQAVQNFFGIHSPSKLFEEIGENLMLGLAKGVDQTGTPSNMLGGFLPSPGAGMGGMVAAAGNGGGVTVNLTYAPVVSLADRYEAEEKLGPYIANAVRKELQRRGAT